jgi:hypothetical protein
VTARSRADAVILAEEGLRVLAAQVVQDQRRPVNVPLGGDAAALLFARIDFAIRRDEELTPGEQLAKALAVAAMLSPAPPEVVCDGCRRCLLGYHCRRCAHRARGGGARHPSRRP